MTLWAPGAPCVLNWEQKVASYHPRSVLKSLQKFHGDRMNGLVSYKGHTYIHTYIHTLIFIYLNYFILLFDHVENWYNVETRSYMKMKVCMYVLYSWLNHSSDHHETLGDCWVPFWDGNWQNCFLKIETYGGPGAQNVFFIWDI